MTSKGKGIKKSEWAVSVPIFHSSMILGQMGIAIGIPFGLLCVFLLVVSGKEKRIYGLYALGIIGALFLLTYILIKVLYGGKYDVGFVLDNNGILCYTQPSQANKNRIMNTLTVVLGLLSGKAAVAGAGLLAGTKQTAFLRWSKVQKVRYYPQKHVIMLRGGFTDRIAVFCLKENYMEVEAAIKEKLKYRGDENGKTQ